MSNTGNNNELKLNEIKDKLNLNGFNMNKGRVVVHGDTYEWPDKHLPENDHLEFAKARDMVEAKIPELDAQSKEYIKKHDELIDSKLNWIDNVKKNNKSELFDSCNKNAENKLSHLKDGLEGRELQEVSNIKDLEYNQASLSHRRNIGQKLLDETVNEIDQNPYVEISSESRNELRNIRLRNISLTEDQTTLENSEKKWIAEVYDMKSKYLKTFPAQSPLEESDLRDQITFYIFGDVYTSTNLIMYLIVGVPVLIIVFLVIKISYKFIRKIVKRNLK